MRPHKQKVITDEGFSRSNLGINQFRKTSDPCSKAIRQTGGLIVGGEYILGSVLLSKN